MAYRTIKLKVHEDYIQEEGTLTAVEVDPGMLLERTSAGTFQAHSTEGGPAEVLVCVEDEGQGNEVSDSYSASSRVVFIAARKGDVFALKMTDTDSSGRCKISQGEFLESNGDGYLRSWSAATGVVDSASALTNQFYPLAIALEAIDMTDSSGVHGADLLVKARIV